METGPVGAAIDTSELYRYIWVQIGGVNCVWEKYRRWDFFGSHYILRAEVHLVLSSGQFKEAMNNFWKSKLL